MRTVKRLRENLVQVTDDPWPPGSVGSRARLFYRQGDGSWSPPLPDDVELPAAPLDRSVDTVAPAPATRRPRSRAVRRAKPVLARAWELGLRPRPDLWGRPAWKLREPKDPSKSLPPGVWEVKQ